MANAGSASAGLTTCTVCAKTVSPGLHRQSIGLGTGELSSEPLPRVSAEVDADLEAEADDPLDGRLDDAGQPTDPRKDMTKSLAGRS